MNERRIFPNHAESVTKARRFVAESIRGLPTAARELVELMISELATNAVRHTDSEFVVSVEVTNDQIRVEVTDRGAGEPATRTPAPLEPSGRGLRIVEALSDGWGVIASATKGKTVWFTVDFPRSATG